MKLALFDIDGVVADDSHRVPLALAGDLEGYFDAAAMSADPPHVIGIFLVQYLVAKGWTIAYLTSRRETLRIITEDWLDREKLPMGRLMMRSAEQTMPAANFKSNYLRRLLASGNYTDVVLYDDDPEVIRYAQESFGSEHAVHCTWQIKEKSMVKKATA